MNERMVNYKCESCGAIGELNEYYDFLQCPQCQGKMLPLNTLDELMSSNFVPPNLDDDATISISREFIPKSHKGVKVAAAVDIGFGGMLSSTITGKYAPLSQSGSSTEPARFAPPPPPPPPKPVSHHNTHTNSRNRMSSTTTSTKSPSKSKKAFTMNKKKKPSHKTTGSFTPTSTTQSRPTKTSLRIKPVKKKVLRTPHKQTNHYSTMQVAEDEIETKASMGMEQTQKELYIPTNEIYNTPLPQTETPVEPPSNQQVEEPKSISQPQDISFNIENIVNDINTGNAVTSPDSIKTTPPANTQKPKIATAVAVEPKKEERKVELDFQANISQDYSPSLPVAENKKTEPPQKEKKPQKEEKNTSANKQIKSNNNNKPTSKPVPKKQNTNNKPKNKRNTNNQNPNAPETGNKNKPNKAKKSALPPPKGMKSTQSQSNKKKPTGTKRKPPVKNNNDKPQTTKQTRNKETAQNQDDNSNQTSSNQPAGEFQVTRSGLIRLQEAKKKQIKVILGIIIGVVALIVFFATKACMSAMKSPGRKFKTRRVNANSAVGKYYSKNRASSSSSSYGGRSSSSPRVERSAIYNDFMKLKHDTKKMPQGSADQIEEIIAVWQQFINEHSDSSGDAKYDEAIQYIESLKESKKLYTDGF